MTPPNNNNQKILSPLVSDTPLLDRWFALPDNATELAKVLGLPIVQDALAVLRESGVPRNITSPAPGETGDSIRERAIFGFYAMKGYHDALANLSVLTSVPAAGAPLPPEWRSATQIAKLKQRDE